MYLTEDPQFYEAGTEPQIGDILTVQRKRAIYLHYGIYVGNGRVCHFSGPIGDNLGDSKDNCIRCTSMDDFLRGDPLRIQIIDESLRRYSRKESAERAIGCVGKKEVVSGQYHFMLNNCEHFVTWCIYGKGMSHQIHKIGKIGAAASVVVGDVLTEIAKQIRQIRYDKKKKQEQQTRNNKMIDQNAIIKK